MNSEEQHLNDLVRVFATQWQRLDDPATADRLLADTILVLGANGTSLVPKAAFLAAVTSRTGAVAAAEAPRTTLASATGRALGERMVVATATWEFTYGATAATLVSDFLLERDASDALRCVAYLPRTNVLDHLPQR